MSDYPLQCRSMVSLVTQLYSTAVALRSQLNFEVTLNEVDRLIECVVAIDKLMKDETAYRRQVLDEHFPQVDLASPDNEHVVKLLRPASDK